MFKRKIQAIEKCMRYKVGIICYPDPQSLRPSLQQPLLPDLDLLPEIIPDIHAYKCLCKYVAFFHKAGAHYTYCQYFSFLHSS